MEAGDEGAGHKTLACDLSWVDAGEAAVLELLSGSFGAGFGCGPKKRAKEERLLGGVRKFLQAAPGLVPRDADGEPVRIRAGEPREEYRLTLEEHRECWLYYYSEATFRRTPYLGAAVIFRGTMYFDAAGIQAWLDHRSKGCEARPGGGYWRRGIARLKQTSCVTWPMFFGHGGSIWLKTLGLPRRADKDGLYEMQFLSALACFALCLAYAANSSGGADPEKDRQVTGLLTTLDEKYGAFNGQFYDGAERTLARILEHAPPDPVPLTHPIDADPRERRGFVAWSQINGDVAVQKLTAQPKRRQHTEQV